MKHNPFFAGLCCVLLALGALVLPGCSASDDPSAEVAKPLPAPVAPPASVAERPPESVEPPPADLAKQLADRLTESQAQVRELMQDELPARATPTYSNERLRALVRHAGSSPQYRQAMADSLSKSMSQQEMRTFLAFRDMMERPDVVKSMADISEQADKLLAQMMRPGEKPGPQRGAATTDAERMADAFVAARYSDGVLKLMLQKIDRSRAESSESLEAFKTHVRQTLHLAAYRQQLAAALAKSFSAQDMTFYLVGTSLAEKVMPAYDEAGRGMLDTVKAVLTKDEEATTALAEQRYAEAARLLRETVALMPDDATALNNLAWAAFQTKDEQALAYAERAQVLAPDNPYIIGTVGIIRVVRGDHEGLVHIERAVKLAPDDAVLRLNLAKAYLHLGRKGDAERSVQWVLAHEAVGSHLHAEAKALLEGKIVARGGPR